MSGGYFNYLDERLKDEIFSYSDKSFNVFEDLEISELVWDILELIHTFDRYKCCDISRETYLKKKSEFKKKWFGTKRGLRIRQVVDESIEELRHELYETFDLNVEGDT